MSNATIGISQTVLLCPAAYVERFYNSNRRSYLQVMRRAGIRFFGKINTNNFIHHIDAHYGIKLLRLNLAHMKSFIRRCIT